MSAGRRLVPLSLGTLLSIVVTCCQRSPPRPLAFRVSEAISTLVTKVAEPLRGGTEGTAIRSLRTDAVPSSGLLEGASCPLHSHHDVIGYGGCRERPLDRASDAGTLSSISSSIL